MKISAADLGVTDRHLLKKALQERLSEAYCAASGQAQQSRYFNNAAFSVRPDGKHTLTSELVGSGDPFNREKPLRIAVMADLFAMERKVKLSLAGIENSRFRIREKCDGIRMNFIIDLDGLSGKEVYDVILLIHLLTHYSLTDFQLSYSRGAGQAGFCRGKSMGRGICSGRQTAVSVYFFRNRAENR